MKLKLFSLALSLWMFSSSAVAQMAGNHVYGHNSYSNGKHNVQISSITSTDSTVIITTKVMLNKKADHYRVHIGVSQFGLTVQEANSKFDARINRLIKQVKKLGISKNDLYLDFVSKVKVYDHEVNGNHITEQLEGFRLQKNLIIKFKDLDLIDSILEECANEDIHDIIKVDYLNLDTDQVVKTLETEAEKILEKKKVRYNKFTSTPITKPFRVVNDHLLAYYPENLYSKYDEAHETSTITSRGNNRYIQKDERKNQTFYYDGVESSYGVDKVIDNISPVIGIQYVYELTVMYKIEP